MRQGVGLGVGFEVGLGARLVLGVGLGLEGWARATSWARVRG